MSQRFILLQVLSSRLHQEHHLKEMTELEQLVLTYGGEVVNKSTQYRNAPSPDMYIGTGKVEWLKEVVKAQEIEVVVLNDIVKSSQLFRLEKALWEVNTKIAVWDRVDLILNIFDQHATSTEACLQIELARINHRGPRIYGLGGTVLSRQGGGVGTRGLGETNSEIERRNIKKITQNLQKQLKQRAGEQAKRIQQRQQHGIQTVALVGYTSAGKTSLFNALTRKEKKAEQALFTTLDSVVGKLKLTEYAPTVLMSDTIGFIDNLPPFLIDAFRSTLMESVSAQMLLHVIDATDTQREHKIKVVKEILKDLPATQNPWLIFNKVDLLTPEQQKYLAEQYQGQQHLLVSARTGQGLTELKELVNDTFMIGKEKIEVAAAVEEPTQ